MNENIFTKEIKYCKGVGLRYADILQKKHIHTLYDLLTFFPRNYEDRTTTVSINDALYNGDKTSVVLGEIVDISTFTMRYSKKPLVIITDGISVAEIPIYAGRVGKFVEKGKKIYVTGKFKRNYRGRVQCQMTDIEAPNSDAISYGKIVPIYPLTEGLSQKKLRSLIQQEIINFERNPSYSIAKPFVQKVKITFAEAITQMHFPTSFERLEVARKALVLEEFAAFQYIHLTERRPNILIKEPRYNISTNSDEDNENNVNNECNENGETNNGNKDNINNSNNSTNSLKGSFKDKILGSIAFNLTDDQENVLREIDRDLLSERQMFRLLQGDVGSGKTIVALLSSMTVVQSSYQVAMLAPTEILVKQHYKNIKSIIKNAGLEKEIRVDILTSSNTDAERGYTIKALREGRTSIIVATHSILNDEVVFKNLGLAIVDEQHRFGTAQRDKLLHKGENVDYLLMTATPIPQSLAYAIFGELDVSIIKSMPKSRKAIHTKFVEKNERDHPYKFLQNRIKKGEQGYVVFPFIDDNNEHYHINLTDTFAYAKKTYFPNANIEMLHGKMKDDEKNHIMGKFIGGEIDVLFATSVIEVGIDNPNATTILIEGAERFGLSQLHQMRGRVGRGTLEGYCYLILHNELNEIIEERLNIIVSTTDGFKISEADLLIRGSGQFLGSKQSGIPDFKLGKLETDISIMEYTRDKMRAILSDDTSKAKFIKQNAMFIERADYLKRSIASYSGDSDVVNDNNVADSSS